MDDDNKGMLCVTGCTTHRDPMGQSYSTPAWAGSSGVFRLCFGVRFASPRACYLALRALYPGDGEGFIRCGSESRLVAREASRLATPRRAPYSAFFLDALGRKGDHASAVLSVSGRSVQGREGHGCPEAEPSRSSWPVRPVERATPMEVLPLASQWSSRSSVSHYLASSGFSAKG